jgi:hypothetical protein
MDRNARREFRARFLAWLRTHVEHEQADNLYYHLGDLLDACANVVQLIEEMPSAVSDEEMPAGIRHILAALSHELLEHIPEHSTAVRDDLLSWRLAAFEDAEKRGQL